MGESEARSALQHDRRLLDVTFPNRARTGPAPKRSTKGYSGTSKTSGVHYAGHRGCLGALNKCATIGVGQQHHAAFTHMYQ